MNGPDNLHWIGSPKDQGVAGNGHKEGAELGALGGGISTSVESKVPNDDKIGNASNGVPSPLLRSSLGAECGKEAGQNHDHIGSNSHEDVGAGHTSQKTKVKEEERSGNCPVNITSPEDLAVNMLECIGDVVMLVANSNLVNRDTMAGSHCKV